MKPQDIAEIVVVAAVAMGCAPFLAAYMARVFSGAKHPLTFLEPVETLFYRITGIDPGQEMGWKKYALSLLAFSGASIALLFLILVGQGHLPLNPQKFPGMKWDLALNTAISFITNTNWQAYSGEAALSYFSQAVGLAVQNFLSAAAGMAVAVAVIRGIAAHRMESDGKPAIGNFWVDMTRSVLYVLLPLSIIIALILVSQGVVQSLSGYAPALSLEGKSDLIPLGPAASQVAIKHLGTNGGGFFGPNSAFPFENPTPLSNIVEVIAQILIPFAFPLLFGRMIGKKRQGRVIFAVMLVILVALVFSAVASEQRWGSMEGKETRFGKSDSALFAVLTTITSCGAVNAMHDSFSPLGGMIPMIDIMLGEVIFGGVGSGLYGMLALVFITVFIAGLMVGRSPEYLGKKIEAREIQLAMLAIIAPNFIILAFSAVAIALPVGLAGLANRGPHGLSEILYAYTSGAGNNGSAFGGLSVNTPFYNLTIGADMLIGRFGVMFPMLGLAGGLASKKLVAPGAGSFKTDTATFGVLLVAVVVIVAGLTHFPALTLGPILDHFLMTMGVTL
ncbi:MAG: potassium-transporting ATPase subunit KdpA [Rectinemataceae bacterium]